MVRSFDLKAEAEMRLDSDRRAEELARKRRESSAAVAEATQTPVPAGGSPPAGAAEGDDGEQYG
ncbi:hypothetical protein OHU45_14615 [Streptomyces tubercidicus]|uniref:hypothetical protein n=1 Tax=Streptomyces tubercidicus TaxID=47759 RepID=UPI002E1555BE|nr:hypothetical protein OG761_14345 [Streptomyces tubercidicus]